MSVAAQLNADIGDFSDQEIKDEYIERFGDPDDWDLSEVDNADLTEEYEKRFGEEGPPAPDDLPEILDLIAEAARMSPYAAKAYDLLRASWPDDVPVLSARQFLIAGRMGDAA